MLRRRAGVFAARKFGLVAPSAAEERECRGAQPGSAGGLGVSPNLLTPQHLAQRDSEQGRCRLKEAGLPAFRGRPGLDDEGHGYSGFVATTIMRHVPIA